MTRKSDLERVRFTPSIARAFVIDEIELAGEPSADYNIQGILDLVLVRDPASDYWLIQGENGRGHNERLWVAIRENLTPEAAARRAFISHAVERFATATAAANWVYHRSWSEPQASYHEYDCDNIDSAAVVVVELHNNHGGEPYATWNGGPPDRRFNTIESIDQLCELILVRLRAAQYKRAQQARESALDELRDQLRASNESGHSVARTDLLAASGLARQTVWDALAGKKRTNFRELVDAATAVDEAAS